MKKTFLIPFIAVLALLMVSFVSADDLIGDVAVEFNGIPLEDFGMTMAGFTGETVPVRVAFEATTDAEDVRIKVWIEGSRDDVEARTDRFNIVDGSVYSKLLSLELPSELKDTQKEFTLHVSISSADGYDSGEYTIMMQRGSYDFEILSVDYDNEVSSGDSIPVMVVVKNLGMQDLDDGYVVVAIDELGISKRGYLGDLASTEDCTISEDDFDDDQITIDCDSDDEDSVQKTVYLQIPDNAENGVYEMTVRVYNGDTSTIVRKLIKVEGAASTQVLAAVKNQDMEAGETKTYDLIVVNSGNNVRIYNVQTVSGTSLDVSAPSVVTVGPDSSETVQITVTTTNGIEVGAYTFTVSVDGQAVAFGANITSGGASSGIVALTVVLIVVFVVLLIVLIVLLTRKERPIEEAETSYY